jgi:hypothetical protein
MYCELGERQRVELINQLSALPQYIHGLAMRGLLADRLPEEKPKTIRNVAGRRGGRGML